MGNKENQCEKGCDKYKQTMDEVVDALAKHSEGLKALKQVSENQREKISYLREE